MLTRLANGNVEVSVRPPLVYLDHWAIRVISENSAHRGDFLETFRTRGTLMFSVVNILEIARNTGESYSLIRDLLDAIEPYWVLSDPDPGTVHDRELRGILAPEAFHVPVDIFAAIYRSMPEGTLRLGAAVESLQDQEFLPSRRAWAASRVKPSRCSMHELLHPWGTTLWLRVSLVGGSRLYLAFIRERGEARRCSHRSTGKLRIRRRDATARFAWLATSVTRCMPWWR